MRATSTLINTTVTETPFALIAATTLPETLIGEFEATSAESARPQA